MEKKDTPMFSENRLKGLLPLALLLIMVYMAFTIRMYPAYTPYYPDIDTYYIFRMASYVLTNNFHMPLEDSLRYYPTYISPEDEDTGVYYFPTATYTLLKGAGLTTQSYADFSWWFPALIGALTLIPMYFIGKILHNRLTGLFAAFFFAVSPAILSRDYAWYVDKEAQAMLFLMVSLYFFIRAMKKSSVLSAVLSGLSLLVLASMWGGVQELFIGYGMFVLISLLVNKAPESLYKIFPAVVLTGVLLPADFFTQMGGFTAAPIMINIAALFVLASRYAVEKYKLVPEEKIPMVAPALYAAGILAILVGSFFSSSIAGLLTTASQYLFFKHGVISSTVAENIPPTWGDYEAQLGITYAQGMFPSLALLIKSNIFDMWLLGFLGIFVLLYNVYEKKDYEFWLTGIASLLMMYSYYAFLSTGEGASRNFPQALFVLSFASVLVLVSRKNTLGAFLLSLLFVSMLGSMSKIRVIFLVAPFLALTASYGLANIISRVSQHKIFRPEDGGKINVFSFAGVFVIGLFLLVNFAAGSVMAQRMQPLYNQNWDGAMKYMKTQTPNGSVILSWWDYGYWFQLMGGRASNLDGGNGIANRNIPTAQFFTGMMNGTEQEFFLQKMGTTHVLVDASMIGKYAAMSKIANYGNKIDAYLQFGAAGSQQQGNTTILAYSASPYFLLVPVNPEGRLAGNIVISVPDGEAYISSICNEKGIFPLNPPKNKRIIDGCVFLGQGYALFASGEVANSVFTKLFFMDGLGIPYLDKVFDNGEVKIYKVNGNVTHETREELLPWWNKYFDGSGLLVFDGKSRVYQKVE